MSEARHSSRNDSPRLVLPKTLVKVLDHLLDELGSEPHPARVQLLAARNAVCRAYRLPLPGAPADSIELEHELNPEEDIG